ncbi:MAG: histidine kinase [Microthrixaceae bacterium]|nr:histidine kinase [Microthrixaceae bacterium]
MSSPLEQHGLSPAFAPPPGEPGSFAEPGAPAPAQEPDDDQPTGKEGWRSRLRSRLSREMRDAMIDPSVKPTGDFDIVAEQMPSGGGDRVAGFSSLITAMRLATVAISLLLAASNNQLSTATRIWTAVIVGYAVFRAFKPVTYDDDVASLVRVIGEVALHVLAITYTGGWDSPLVFTLLTPIALAGLARGFGFSLRVAVAAVIATSWPYVLGAADSREALTTSASWGSIVIIVAVIAGYARRISGEAVRERELALDRLSRLSDANTLLFSLHRVTQTLPASLDLDDVLDSTLGRMKSLVSYDSVAVLLFDETDGRWAVARHHGLHVPRRFGATDLAPGLRRALTESRPVYVADVPSIGGGLNPRAGSGIYTVMPARGSVIGLIAIEHTDVDHFSARDVELIEGFVAPASLAVDNARWFARLRTVGADEERTRIARDLHDRIGQSLAYLAFQLDHIVEREAAGEPVAAEIGELREDVRGVIREVRDTLYDLRTDVSDSVGLGEVLEQFVDRVSERSGLKIQIDADRNARLPLLQEREMWRVAQEALANVERHAQATAVRIVWRCDGQRALIEVTDNGVGFESGRAGRLDSYGMLGMRERASSIGASLEILSAPGRGTRVRCVLDPSAEEENGEVSGPAGAIQQEGAGAPAPSAVGTGRQA